MAGPAARFVLKWLPVALGLAVLSGFVGYRLYQRTMQRAMGPLRGQPISAPALEGKAPDDLLNRLGVAMSLRDILTAERLAEELSRRGDDVLPSLARLLLWLDPIPPEPVFNVVLKYFKPRAMAMALILEISKTQWIGIGPAPRKLRILIGRGILLHSKDLEPAIDLNALLGARFDQTLRVDGRLGMALLAVRLKIPSRERLVRALLPGLKDQSAREELLGAIAEEFGRQGAPFLASLLLDPACADAKMEITQVLQPLLPADDAMAVLLSSTKPDAETKDQVVLAEAVSRIVETSGMDLIRRAWPELKGAAPKCGILMGLGDLKTRQDVGEFLLGIARSSENAEVRGTALLSLSRQSLNHAEAFAIAAQHLAATSTPEIDDVYELKASAILALENLYTKESFVAETRAIFRDLLLKESNTAVIRDCLRVAIERRMVELRETVQKLALQTTSDAVKAAAAKYLETVR
jgi:hypothetical protein